jgi:hypothetical protein
VFQQRQVNEIYDVEVSFTAAASPGAITNGSVATASLACTLGGGANAATFGLGDILEVVAPASAALNGVAVSAQPTATAGTALLIFLNNTGGSITPTASSIYKIIARRIKPNVNS